MTTEPDQKIFPYANAPTLVNWPPMQSHILRLPNPHVDAPKKSFIMANLWGYHVVSTAAIKTTLHNSTFALVLPSRDAHLVKRLGPFTRRSNRISWHRCRLGRRSVATRCIGRRFGGRHVRRSHVRRPSCISLVRTARSRAAIHWRRPIGRRTLSLSLLHRLIRSRRGAGRVIWVRDRRLRLARVGSVSLLWSSPLLQWSRVSNVNLRRWRRILSSHVR